MRRLVRDRPSLSESSPVKFSLKEVMRSVNSPHVIIILIISFMDGTMLYGLGVFLPSIINELGFDANKTQLLSAGPFTAGYLGECFLNTAGP